jgi:hypothetical protein
MEFGRSWWVYGERERDGSFGVDGCVPRGDFVFHQPVRRLDNDGLSGVCVELLALVFNSARPFLFLRVNVNPRGELWGNPGVKSRPKTKTLSQIADM